MHFIQRYLLKVGLVLLIFLTSTHAQIKNPIPTQIPDTLKTIPQDMALYDQYNLNYKFSQATKGAIKYGSIGFVTGLAATGALITYKYPKEGIGAGIAIALGTTIGTVAGFVTGATLGYYKGARDAHFKSRNPNFYHKMDYYGYNVYASLGIDTAGSFSSGFSIIMRNNLSSPFYPNRIAVQFAIKSTIFTKQSVKNEGYNLSISEKRLGVAARFYPFSKGIVNTYYQPAIGYAFSEYNNLPITLSDPSFIYTSLALGVELNVWDFLSADISFLVEPISPVTYAKVDNYSSKIYFLNLSIGAYLF